MRLSSPFAFAEAAVQAYYENDMLAMARQILTCGHVFFSFTMDLTRPIQHQMDLGLAPDGGDCLADDVRRALCAWACHEAPAGPVANVPMPALERRYSLR